MKIVGLNRLDSNFYQEIIIYDDMITVLGTNSNLSSREEFQVPKAFSCELEGLSDAEVIDRVISYFLNYNKIVSLSVKPEDRFVGVLSEYGGKLELRGKNTEKFLKKIIDRYYHDREEFFLKLDDYQNVLLDTSLEDVAYSLEDDSIGKTLKICLLLERTKDGDLVIYGKDVLFSKKVIDETLEGNIAEVNIWEDYAGVDYLEKACIISSSDDGSKRKICISDKLIPFTDFIVDSHNSEVFSNRCNEKVERNKVLQMKMEGF